MDREMKYTKVFADEKGETHFQDVEIELETLDFAPPAQPINFSRARDMLLLFVLQGGSETGIRQHEDRLMVRSGVLE
jgi:hypothetical protein